MKTRRSRITVGRLMIAVALTSLLLGGYVVSLKQGYRQLTVVNLSGQPVARLAIHVWGERREIENLADGASASVPYWGGEGTQITVAGSLNDRTRINSSIRISGDPKRFQQVMGTVEPDGRFRLSLKR